MKSINQQRSTLPGSCPPSTLDAGGLYFCVRYGNRCGPSAIITGYAIDFVNCNRHSVVRHRRLQSMMINRLSQVHCLLDLFPNLMSADICFAKSFLYPENCIYVDISLTDSRLITESPPRFASKSYVGQNLHCKFCKSLVKSSIY